MIAKAGYPDTVAEKLIKPAMDVCVREVLGDAAADSIKAIPLSNDTIRRRQDEMGSQLEVSLVSILRRCPFSLQIDESTVFSSAILLAYVRYFDDTNLREEMLFIKNLTTDTTGLSIFDTVVEFFEEKTPFH